MGDKILVIEDSQDMRENIAELLGLAGYEVIKASNGKEGLEQLRNTRPDLILCDIMMPELDGFGVLRAIDNLPEFTSTPFVFLTARSEKEDFRRGMDLGADDYLSKPFQGDELLRVIAARLKKSRVLRNTIDHDAQGASGFLCHPKNKLSLELIAEKNEKKKFRKKDIVFMEGDTSNQLCFIVAGKIKTYRTNEEGKEYITGIHKEGDFFGYLTLTDESIRKETAMAIEDTEIAMLSKQDFLKLLSSNRELMMQFINFVTNNLDEAEQRLLKLAYNSARSRVAEALIFICKKYQAKDGDTIPLSRDNLSTLAGVSPESASRNLSDFRDEGLIETYHGTVKICCMSKLEHMRY